MLAVARQLQLEHYQIVIVRETLASFADSEGFVTREAFDLALLRAKITEHRATQIFDLLFTMWDSRGEGMILARPFVIGIAPLACVGDHLGTVLHFSLHIADDCNNGLIGPTGLHNMLACINNTASYFGDAQLNATDIDCVIDAVFEGSRKKIPHAREYCFVFLFRKTMDWESYYCICLLIVCMILFFNFCTLRSVRKEAPGQQLHSKICLGKDAFASAIQSRVGGCHRNPSE